MSTRIRMSSDELARLRFAISPATETLIALQVLRDPGRHAIHLPWVSWARPRLGAVRDLRLLRALVDTRVKPAFLVPVPDTRMPGIADEVEQIRATPPTTFVRRLQERYDGSLPAEVYADLRADPEGGLGRIADALLECFEAVIAPHWGRIRTVLEADIAYRATVLSEHGVETALAGLHRDVSWRQGVLLVDDRPGRVHDVDLAGHGLVLSPSAFCWPEVRINIKPITAGTLRYPARGVGALWERGERYEPALAALIGRTRADLLGLLKRPQTTGELSGSLAVTAAAVSQHLGVLRRAGLVTSRRDGRTLLHLRTERGDILASPAGPPEAPGAAAPQGSERGGRHPG